MERMAELIEQGQFDEICTDTKRAISKTNLAYLFVSMSQSATAGVIDHAAAIENVFNR